jgi:hypothetical protein
MTEPTFDKAVEEYDAYLADARPSSPPAMLIRGRDRKDPLRPGHFMCDRHKAAKRSRRDRRRLSPPADG